MELGTAAEVTVEEFRLQNIDLTLPGVWRYLRSGGNTSVKRRLLL